jgi:serine/threonine protein phosphatase PrpC
VQPTPRRAKPRFDVSSAMAMGQRAYQEDALATDFPDGPGLGLAVLADGMGGHAAGDIASRIVVSEVFAALRESGDDPSKFRTDAPAAMRAAAQRANAAIFAHWSEHRESRGMGATLVALVFDAEKVWWISIGDSPLFLFRSGKLTRLNEDHSLAPQIDYLVLTGQMDPEVGRNHPERSCLTSVIGGDAVERVDCPDRAFTLKADDLLIVGSDGIETLENDAIVELLTRLEGRSAADIGKALMAAVDEVGDPEQDNVSFTVIRPQFPRRPISVPALEPSQLITTEGSVTRRLLTGLANALGRRGQAPRKDMG